MGTRKELLQHLWNDVINEVQFGQKARPTSSPLSPLLK